MALKVSQKELVALFTALGARNAETWKQKDLENKLGKIESLVDEDETLDPAAQKLLDKILKAQKKGEEVTIEMNGKKEDPPEIAAAKKAHDKKVKGKASKDEDEEDDEEDDDSEDDEEEEVEEEEDEDSDDDEEESEEDEDEDEPAPKKKPGKKAPAKPEKPSKDKPGKKPVAGKDKPEKKKGKAPPKGVGVIQCIQDIVSAATAKKPVTKEQIHEKLCKRFPDRDADSLKTTVGIQVPSRLNKEKGMNIKKSDKGGYYAG